MRSTCTIGFPYPCIYEYVFIVLSVTDVRLSNNFLSQLGRRGSMTFQNLALLILRLTFT